MTQVRPKRVVVLAGRRAGEDPLAEAAGAPHRALLDIEGEPMLMRVLRRLLGFDGVEEVLVNFDAESLLDDIPAWGALRDRGVATVLASQDSPSRSVMESLDAVALDEGPVLVTTADHALLDDAMLEAYFAACEEELADVYVALVPRTVIEARFPEAKRTYLRFRGESYSGANLFLFRTPEGRRAVEFWQRVENERKKPWRLARGFGLVSLVLFLLRRLDLDQAMVRASRVIGARVVAIPLEIAEAAVDVDKIEDLELVRKVLKERYAKRSSSTRTKVPDARS
jgi:GTP:adenosylcobinamide-phosphate guanylyltransferase